MEFAEFVEKFGRDSLTAFDAFILLAVEQGHAPMGLHIADDEEEMKAFPYNVQHHWVSGICRQPNGLVHHFTIESQN